MHSAEHWATRFSWWEKSTALPLGSTKHCWGDHFPHPSLQPCFPICHAMSPITPLSKRRSLFALSDSFNSPFLSYHIFFLARPSTFHLFIPSSSAPRFKEAHLWFPLLGASCCRNVCCKQSGFGDNLPFKTLNLFLKTLSGAGLCARWAQQCTNPVHLRWFFVLSYLLLSCVSFTFTRKVLWNIGHLICVIGEVLNAVLLPMLNTIIQVKVLVNISEVLKKDGLMQSLLSTVWGAKHFGDNSYILMYFFQSTELYFNVISTGEQGEPRPAHYRCFSM